MYKKCYWHGECIERENLQLRVEKRSAHKMSIVEGIQQRENVA